MGPQPWSEGLRDLSSRGRDTTLVQIDRNPHLRIFEWPYKPSQSTLENWSQNGLASLRFVSVLRSSKFPFFFSKGRLL